MNTPNAALNAPLQAFAAKPTTILTDTTSKPLAGRRNHFEVASVDPMLDSI